MSKEIMPFMKWDSHNLLEAFALFKQKMELFFVIKRVKNEEKVAYILSGMDDEGLRRYNSWTLTEDQKEDHAYLWTRFEEQLNPSQNFRVARLKMHFFYQKETKETLDEFVTKCREQAQKCEFTPDETNERILEQVIASTPIQDFQKELLNKPKGYTVQDALKLGRSYEATERGIQELKSMNIGTQETTIKTDAIKTACLNCGGDHPRKPKNKCPAYSSTCSACGKQGHWRKVCLTSRYSRKQSYNRPHRSFSNRRGKQTRSSSPSPARQSKGSRNRSGQRTNTEFDAISFESITISSMCLDEQERYRDEAYAIVDIDLNRRAKCNLKLKVDTGAQGNTLPVRTFRNMFPDLLDDEGYPAVNKIKSEEHTRLIAYNETPIKCFGSIDIPCRYDSSQWLPTKFYIVEVQGPAVIGLKSSCDLGAVTMHCAITHVNGLKEQQTATTTTDPAVINSVDDLLKMFPGQFDKIGNFPGTVNLHLKEDATPYIDPPRKFSIHMRDKLKQELDKMENQSVIRKVQEHTDWCSSLAFSTKADGSLRVCLDPAKLNKALKRCPHKIPTVEEMTHKLNGAKFFSKLDAKAGYWSLKLDPESTLLTTFRTPFGRYCFERLPFGLAVSQDLFQQRMDSILEQCDGADGITDDVVVHGRTEEEHDKNLLQLMKVANKNGLMFNSKKCFIKQNQISFFGMVYDAEGVHPDPKKVDGIQGMPTPNNKKELQEFLGLIQYLSLFIPNLAEKAATLRQLLKKDVPFVWDETYQNSFETLKALINADATLQYYDTTSPVVLQVDASQKGLGAALLQPNQRGEERPIAYASKSLTDTETRYANIEREMLAVCFGVERFKTYVYGRSFHIVTDHKPLIMILNKNITSAPPRLQRMMLKLQGYTFTIEYRPGKLLTLPDSLSRLPNPENQQAIDLDVRVDHVQFSTQKISDVQNQTRADPVLHQLIGMIIQGWPDTLKEVPTDLREYWSFRDELSVENGVLLKGERVIIPKPLQKGILEQLHTGHLGRDKTILRARQSVYWHRINSDVDLMCKQCCICQEFQRSQQHESLHQHEVPTKPWDYLGTDLFSLNGDNYLVIADYYSKYIVVRKLPDRCPSSKVVAISKQVFAEHGIPSTVMSDNGPHYNSAEYERFAFEWGFQHVTSSPHYPRSNGFVERQIQTIKNTIKKAKRGNEDIDLALLSLRTTPIDHKLPSPAELLFNRKIKDTLPVHTSNKSQGRDDVINRLNERQTSQKTNHDRSARDLPPLYKGQNILIQDQNSKRWKPGQVQDTCDEPRSYMVKQTDGGTLRRNRHQLREKSVSFDTDVKTYDGTGPESNIAFQSPPVATNDSYMTRSGRSVKPPARYGQE